MLSTNVLCSLSCATFCSHVAVNMPSSRGICKVWKKGALMDGNVHVAYMTDVPVKTREEAEGLVLKGFGLVQNDELQDALCLNEKLPPPCRTRSGRKSSGRARESTEGDDTWLVWVTHKDDGRMLGTAIVYMPANNHPVLLYITVEPNPCVRGKHVLFHVLALLRRRGHSMLLSAVQQGGKAFGGEAHSSAKEAHDKWGFHEIDKAEWRQHSPGLGYEQRDYPVTLMKKVLGE